MNFSKFAHQFSGESGILQLMSDLGTSGENPRGELMLGGGNPAKIPAVELRYRSEMERLLADDQQFEAMTGSYDAPQGNLRFINALVNLLNETYNWQLTPGNIAVTNGSQAGFGIIFNLFSGQFDDGSFKSILLPMTPEYIGYSDVGIGEKNIFRANQPRIEINQSDSLFYKYRVNFEALTVNSECGAICISRPTNPTGNVITDNELAKLSLLAKKAHIPLILDGAYGQPFPGIIFSDAEPVWEDHIILCLSLSKLGLPGARTGIVVANSDVIDMMKNSNGIF